MGSKLQCTLCGKQVTCNPSEVATLGEHLLKSHPAETVTHFSFDNGDDNSEQSTVEKTLESKFYKRTNRRLNKKMYKTTVETWKPGSALLECPQCGKSGLPIVRKQRNKITQSSLGALCLLGCWPVCFLPFILGGTNKMNLHCKFCGKFLGTYDRKTGELQQTDEHCACPKPIKTRCDCNK